jgi:antitoxin Xre/MbcA/ParS-like protein
MTRSRYRKDFGEEAIVLTKAMIRAADRLGLSQKTLASIIGASESGVSRMRHQTSALERGRGKCFELAELFVQMFVLLDGMVIGDMTTAKAWLRGENIVLGSRPIDLIQTAQGLVNVVNYLRKREYPEGASES